MLVITCGCDSSPSVTRARLGMKDLDKAVTNYRIRNKTWPANLEALTEQQPDGTKADLAAGALVDPWGHPYHYEPSDRQPDTDQPLIWSEGPSPGQPGSKMVNWQTKD